MVRFCLHEALALGKVEERRGGPSGGAGAAAGERDGVESAKPGTAGRASILEGDKLDAVFKPVVV